MESYRVAASIETEMSFFQMMMVDPDCPHMTVYMANPRHDVDVYIYIYICIDIRYVYNTCTKKLGDAV